MIRATIEFPRGFVDEFKRFSVQRLERAMLKAADKASRKAQGEVRAAMAGAGLGRLGQAVGQFSDEKKGRGVHRLGGESFSASGGLSIRSRSERTIGAIRAYTEGAQIRPVKGRWLWIASDQLQRIVGKGAAKRRLTPALYKSGGLEQKVGPLVPVRRPNGYGLRDLGSIEITRHGVIDEDPGVNLRTIDFALAWQSEAEFEASFRPMIEKLGKRGIVYLCFDPEPTIYRQARTYLGVFDKPPFARGVRLPRTFMQEFQIISLI